MSDLDGVVLDITSSQTLCRKMQQLTTRINKTQETTARDEDYHDFESAIIIPPFSGVAAHTRRVSLPNPISLHSPCQALAGYLHADRNKHIWRGTNSIVDLTPASERHGNG
jgi:hypothetical protein